MIMSEPLLIATDVENISWLQYILEEFRRIQKFQHPIQVISLAQAENPQHKNVFFYTREFRRAAAFVNKSDVIPDNTVVWLSAEMYVTQHTTTQDNRFVRPYDLFWNAFVFLSRLEEYLLSQSYRSFASHCVLHPRKDRASLRVPIVNILFAEMEAVIRRYFPHLRFGVSDPPVIELSHDVDYIAKSPDLVLKQTVLNGYDIFRSLSRPSDCAKNVKKTAAFFFSRPSYWCFDYWRDLEKKYKQRSVFYIYVCAQPKNLKTWFIDPNYFVSGNTRLQHQLKDLIADGFEVGLHGSFYGAVKLDLLKKEKEILEGVLGRPVDKVRQHWLRFVEDKTPYIHDALFRYDSTLGWNDRVGFRSGCASRFHPFDHHNQKPFQYLETPQIVMDFNVYQALGLENKIFVDHMDQVIAYARTCASAYVSVSWHERSCNEDYGWHELYEKIVRENIKA